MKYIKLIITAVVLLVIFAAIFQNQEMFNDQYKFQLDFKIFETPAYYVKNYALIGIAFVLGVLISIFLGIFSSSRKRGEIKIKNQRIKELEKEISSLQSSKALGSTPGQPETTSPGSDVTGFNTPSS